MYIHMCKISSVVCAVHVSSCGSEDDPGRVHWPSSAFLGSGSLGGLHVSPWGGDANSHWKC